MSKRTKQSAAVQLLELVWGHANQATSHSWERLNHAMREALRLAIGAGLLFAEQDVSFILSNFRSGYWIGASDEWLYSCAIANGNMSAIQSYEAAKGRSPFIADDVRPTNWGNGPYLDGDPGERQRERLAVGSEFIYGDLRPTVTSFNDDKGYLTACTYERRDDGRRGKIQRRLKLTPQDIQADRAARKKAREDQA